MAKNNFFEEQKEQSEIKSLIVEKYFVTWASIMIQTQKNYPHHAQKIAYIDLFAGPGRYSDGSESTPLKILTRGISEPDFRERLITLFNDKDENHSNTLRKTIEAIPDI